MFGKTIDYKLLRLFAHDGYTEAEELRQIERKFGIDFAKTRFDKWNGRLHNKIPIDPNLHYLDVGCGMGEMSLALALYGCRNVTAIDKDPHYVEIAKRWAREMHVQDKVAFECMNVHDLPNEKKYDVVLSHEMFEHVERPYDCLRRMVDVLKPRCRAKANGGVMILAFGPLFHSPLGGHLHKIFRFRIPWIGVLFSEAALMRLRRECSQPVADEATSFEQTREGLNKMKFSEYLRYVERMPLKTERLIVNPQLKRWPALWRLSNLLLRVPGLRDYIAVSVYATYQRL